MLDHALFRFNQGQYEQAYTLLCMYNLAVLYHERVEIA